MRAAADVTGSCVLVVDDDPLSARVVGGLLEEMGCVVRVANGPGAAVAGFKADVDLVLMDVEMPTLDGFKLTRMLRERASSYVPVVFLTGRDDEQSQERGLLAGGDDFLVKPVGRFELKMRVISMLRIRRLTLELERQARVDVLTGVGNRAALERELAARASEHVRYRRPLSILVIDIDHFKKVNDAHGHAAGDEILVQLGAVLRSSIRGADGAFRYGGEEFVVVAPETDAKGAEVLAERIRTRFRSATEDSPYGQQTISIGVATSPTDPPVSDLHELQQRADAALYDAKHGGRDRVCVR